MRPAIFTHRALEAEGKMIEKRSAVFLASCARHRKFPFRKRTMPFSTVDVIIGNQAFQLIVHVHTGLLAVSFYFLIEAAHVLLVHFAEICRINLVA